MLTSGNSRSSPATDLRKRPAQDRSRLTVEAILEAGAQLLAARGYSATTTNHVAERAGVSIGSLYQYFPNKDALVVALAEQHLDQVEEALRAACARWRAAGPAPATWAAEFVQTLVDANDTELHRVLYDCAPPLPRVRDRVDAVAGGLVDETAHHLRRWQAPGRDDETRMRARVIVVAAISTVHELIVRLPVDSPDRNEAHRQLRDLVTRFLPAAVDPAPRPDERA
ncbi:TetR/AcrR family transcriptional regulator [Frankia sp. CNm7]|uniref:TetR/AcrR family transcriptional regulator n=1 Tax=Frankia nepalensis TaxID=1836974 RepID=A0A937R663_9ACTN|nr:TetR/AcrR family transcriptional regulator [Frankia nepalensis]MBL7494763.1 TetR/AcrR family transcriptional regulator [Frankia nepalensis]MBL7514048.1 TetR/AcrR family transcriptional regulator [Frankia nepalensis]MBL7519561.1 TetR/AcrR family transcriptional regulator [Frankia nepalensis]MBL7626463.1 TetR/AcrR family transcriptional regulator [Frankia nepalensis]